jgi:hypothetical protein
VRDRVVEGRVIPGALDINVYPLVITGNVCEAIYPLLRDLEPIADGYLLAGQPL